MFRRSTEVVIYLNKNNNIYINSRNNSQVRIKISKWAAKQLYELRLSLYLQKGMGLPPLLIYFWYLEERLHQVVPLELLEINLHRGQGRYSKEVVEDYLNIWWLFFRLWRHCVCSKCLLCPKMEHSFPFSPWWGGILHQRLQVHQTGLCKTYVFLSGQIQSAEF